MSAVSTPTFTADGHPLRSVLKQDDDSERTSSLHNTPVAKAVQIAEPPPDPDNADETAPKRQYSAGVARRLSGRPPLQDSSSSRTSLLSQSSVEALSSHTSSQSLHQYPQDGSRAHSHHHPHHHTQLDKFLAQVADWLEHERAKKENRKAKRVHSGGRRKAARDEADAPPSQRARSRSTDSESSDVSLDRLQVIVDDGMAALGKLARKTQQRRRSVTAHRTASSDTDYHDGDVLVPACDAVLDNTKTLGYLAAKASAGDSSAPLLSSKREEKERKAWLAFKTDILKLTHTLALKGWRRVPLESSEAIDVTRLSGALTNAVYVVSPPEGVAARGEGAKRTPAKLLLRVYGPQAEHIIDRENELSVLRRLAKKRIGPRLLGTFTNGRFEQYLNAAALTAADLRDPDTSRQIAKRMRELHDGIELLDRERDGGPMVLRNWDAWLGRASRVVAFLDRQILSPDPGPGPGPVRAGPADAWKARGFVCGAEWPAFKAMVDKYRQFLLDYHGGPAAIRDSLVFAHSDTQYGNILRVRPDDKKSPLLQPHYEHKQLVVIDFEYSAANTRGLEFANHFTEWCYNYHDARAPYACDVATYPAPEEQRRFIRAYVSHRPEFPHAAATPTPLATPTMRPSTPGLGPTIVGAGGGEGGGGGGGGGGAVSEAEGRLRPTSSIREFTLDARAPAGGWREEEKRAEEQAEALVEALVREARVWRVANSAQWVAWGVMQAKIPGFDEDEDEDEGASSGGGGGGGPDEDEGDAAEFDYLAYAQERALFFWGDCIRLGLLREEDLPPATRPKVKYLDY
ncbi:kinase-like protein [Durotheca rogersii]|uniref:kinase-like protein n=1 Tax=Durotheca rogersii TaxID=419775 RepID=UPI0022206F3E|nr:kinase-like protein [Durotheca rogersii]KAI5860706.1 kinase-like protein [Durotheca rogersii]